MDDGMVCSVNKSELDGIITYLEEKFEVKRSRIEYYVGFQVKVSKERDKIFIH